MSSNSPADRGSVDPSLFEEEGLGEALETLDAVFERYDEDVSLEVAEESYADVVGDVDTYYRMTFYVDRELEELKRELPGSVFSELPDEYEAYDLQDDGVTLHLKFGEEHEEAIPVDASYENIDVAVPTDEAYFSRFYDEVAERMDE